MLSQMRTVYENFPTYNSKMASFDTGTLKNYGYVIGGTIVLHPFALVRTLIQEGVEPIKPKLHTSYLEQSHWRIQACGPMRDI